MKDRKLFKTTQDWFIREFTDSKDQNKIVLSINSYLDLVIKPDEEITSNTATATLLMPILAAAGVAAGIDPALIMMPAAISASCAFMLPVATAPNSIVYGSGLVSTQRMAREGLALNLVGAVVISSLCYLLV